jgi:isocitrate/isopropylmalate dehydrogenase
MKTYKIAAIPGDGIGTEVIAAGIEVLEMLAKQEGGFELRFEHFDWGSAYYLKHGEMMPADGLARDYPDVETDKMLVDAATMRMVLRPASLDVMVATNLHADILSDLAAALSGSLGIAPTANLDPQQRFPSMFEPIHGSALDIVGKGIANPIGTFWTAVMMLEHLGETGAAARLMGAIESVTQARVFTPDLGGKATTAQVTRALGKVIETLPIHA